MMNRTKPIAMGVLLAAALVACKPAPEEPETDMTALRQDKVAVRPLSSDEHIRRLVRLGRAGQARRALAQLQRRALLPKANRARLLLAQARVLLSNYRYSEAVVLLDKVRSKGSPAERWQAERLLPRALSRAGLLERMLKRLKRRAKRGATPAVRYSLATSPAT